MPIIKYPRPIKPMIITQIWGLFRPDIYSRFGFTRHNGADYGHSKTRMISSPLDGIVVRVGYQPNGGGNFCSVTDGKNLFDFLHCESIIVAEGQRIEVGQPLAIQGNTGFSTGPHTHIQRRPIANWDGFKNWTFTLKNDANDSEDPEAGWTDQNAEDIWNEKVRVSIIKKLIELWKQLLEKQYG